MRRDLAHTCRLLGMFAVLLLLMTWLAITMGSQEGNELVFILNYVIFPSFFVGLAGWLGWKDSRYRENHDLLTRPISLGEMVMAKVVFITGLSVMTALSQSMVNVVLGLDVSLFLLSLTLTLAGLAGYFFTMTLRSGLASPISRVLLICVALLALAMLTNYGMRNWGLRVYGLTIFRMIMGEESPDKGAFVVGETAKIAYVDQKHANIDPEKSIWQNFSDEQELVMMGGKQVNSRAYLSRFNFSGSEQNKKVSLLSGGERNRLHLAMTLKEEGNVLLLDEPTNDLDVNTLRALEEGLENFAGCAVVISHDRWFLDRICTHILAFEGDSQVYFFEGSFSDYEENKKKRLSGDLMPKRIKYKKLVR